MGPLGKPGAKRRKILFLSVSDTETQHDRFMSINDNCCSYITTVVPATKTVGLLFWCQHVVAMNMKGHVQWFLNAGGEPTIAKLGLTLGFSEDNFTDSPWGGGDYTVTSARFTSVRHLIGRSHNVLSSIKCLTSKNSIVYNP